MSSPFSYFRKHQKQSIAVLGVMCMVAFFVIPPLLQMMGGGPAVGQNPAVVSCGYFDLHESDLRNLRIERNQANEFLAGLIALADGPLGLKSAQAWDDQRTEEWLRYARLQQVNRFRQQDYFGPATDRAVVEKLLLVRRAEELGIVVTDQTIGEYLIKGITADTVTTDQLRRLLQELGINARALYDVLRQEIMASQVMAIGLPPADTPVERWADYLRLNRSATIELLPVEAAALVDQVPTPGEEELLAFFEAHKGQVPNPYSDEPGFRVPARAAFQYFKAQHEQFYDESQVTEEEIAEYYEANKADYRRIEFSLGGEAEDGDAPGEQPPTTDPPAPQADPDAAAPDAAPESEGAPTGDAPPEEGSPPPADDAPPGDDGSVSGQEPGDQGAASDEPAPAQTPPPDEPSSDAPPTDAAAAPDEQAATRPSAPEIALVAYQQGAADAASEQPAAAEELPVQPAEPAADPPDEGPTDEGPTVEGPTDEAAGAPADTAGAADPAAGESAAPPPEGEPTASDAAPDDAAAPDADAPGAEAPGESPPADGPSQPGDETAEPPAPVFKPLEEVRDEIRRILARRKAEEAIDAAFEAISTALRGYDAQRQDAIAAGTTVPPLPSFAEVAQQHRVSVHQTALLTQFDLQGTELGRTLIQGIPLPEVAFYGRFLATFRPQQAVSSEADGSPYLVWKVDEREEETPVWDDATRGRVLEDWRLRQASDLARQRAAELAEQARQREQALVELFADRDPGPVQAGPFTWMTAPLSSATGSEPSRISQIDAVPYAGQAFMRDVFALAEGEVGVAANQPRTVWYVVRVVKLDPALDVARDLFFVESHGRYADAGRSEQAEAYRQWIERLGAEAGLTWHRPPDAVAAR